MDNDEAKFINEIQLKGVPSKRRQGSRVHLSLDEIYSCLAFARLTGTPLTKVGEVVAEAKDDMTVAFP